MTGTKQAYGLTEGAMSDCALTIRKAVTRDIPAILDVINGYAAKGVMLPRSEFELVQSIRDFTVALRHGHLVGCGAIHFYSPTVAEVRSLAICQSASGGGVGRHLIDALLEEARYYELHAVFAFTYVVEFFQKVGFERVDRGVLPLKVWKDCIRCRKFQECDEVAVMCILQPISDYDTLFDYSGGSRVSLQPHLLTQS